MKDGPKAQPETGVAFGRPQRSLSDAEVARRLYDMYPRKVARQAALVAIGKALKRVERELEETGDQGDDAIYFLQLRLHRFAISPAGNRGIYTPHPATWFNGSRYLDDYMDWYQGPSDESPIDVIGRMADAADMNEAMAWLENRRWDRRNSQHGEACRKDAAPLSGSEKLIANCIGSEYMKVNGVLPPWDESANVEIRKLLAMCPAWPADAWKSCVKHRFLSEINVAEKPVHWIKLLCDYKAGPLDRFGRMRH